MLPHQASGPGWLNDTRWNILAKIPDGQPAKLVVDRVEKTPTEN